MEKCKPHRESVGLAPAVALIGAGDIDSEEHGQCVGDDDCWKRHRQKVWFVDLARARNHRMTAVQIFDAKVGKLLDRRGALIKAMQASARGTTVLSVLVCAPPRSDCGFGW